MTGPGDFLSHAVCRLSGMDWGKLTEDQVDDMIVRADGEIASWRAVQIAAVGEKRSRDSHRADGYRSIVEWVAARADVSSETARRICWTGSRLEEAPEAAEQLAAGEISFDRAEQLARLPVDKRDGHEGYDIAQLRRLVAHHRRLSRKREKGRTTPAGTYMVVLSTTRFIRTPRPPTAARTSGWNGRPVTRRWPRR